IPNGNDPVTAAPGTVGPPSVAPGDPHGVTLTGTDPPPSCPTRIDPSACSGWQAEWWTPMWSNSGLQRLTDIAWTCVDKNASALATMPPYLVNAAPTLDAGWIV